MGHQKFFALTIVLMMVSLPASILQDSENVQASSVELEFQTAQVYVYG